MATKPIINVDEADLTGLSGKTIIITGASSGIGLETAELFYKLGANVVFVGGRKRPTTDVPLDSPRTLVAQCDVSSWSSQVDVFQATIAKFGKVDAVVANAGVAEPVGNYFNLKVDKDNRPEIPDLRSIDVDMKGTIFTIMLAFHYFGTHGGTVIIVSSLAGYTGVPAMPSYSASKHGATGLLRSLPSVTASKKIAVSLVAPHLTYTPGTFAEKYVPGEEAYQAVRAEMKKLGMTISKSLTCALAIGYLIEEGLKTNGVGVLVDDDEILMLEDELMKSRPEWFLKKSDTAAGSSTIYEDNIK